MYKESMYVFLRKQTSETNKFTQNLHLNKALI